MGSPSHASDADGRRSPETADLPGEPTRTPLFVSHWTAANSQLGIRPARPGAQALIDDGSSSLPMRSLSAIASATDSLVRRRSWSHPRPSR